MSEDDIESCQYTEEESGDTADCPECQGEGHDAQDGADAPCDSEIPTNEQIPDSKPAEEEEAVDPVPTADVKEVIEAMKKQLQEMTSVLARMSEDVRKKTADSGPRPPQDMISESFCNGYALAASNFDWVVELYDYLSSIETEDPWYSEFKSTFDDYISAKLDPVDSIEGATDYDASKMVCVGTEESPSDDMIGKIASIDDPRVFMIYNEKVGAVPVRKARVVTYKKIEGQS